MCEGRRGTRVSRKTEEWEDSVRGVRSPSTVMVVVRLESGPSFGDIGAHWPFGGMGLRVYRRVPVSALSRETGACEEQ